MTRYHWAPLQDDRGPGPFTGACGRPAVYFYTDPIDFLAIPVRRCDECEGLLEIGFVALGVLSCKSFVDFLATTPRPRLRSRPGRIGPTWAARALAPLARP